MAMACGCGAELVSVASDRFITLMVNPLQTLILPLAIIQCQIKER